MIQDSTVVLRETSAIGLLVAGIGLGVAGFAKAVQLLQQIRNGGKREGGLEQLRRDVIEEMRREHRQLADVLADKLTVQLLEIGKLIREAR